MIPDEETPTGGDDQQETERDEIVISLELYRDLVTTLDTDEMPPSFFNAFLNLLRQEALDLVDQESLRSVRTLVQSLDPSINLVIQLNHSTDRRAILRLLIADTFGSDAVDELLGVDEGASRVDSIGNAAEDRRRAIHQQRTEFISLAAFCGLVMSLDIDEQVPPLLYNAFVGFVRQLHDDRNRENIDEVHLRNARMFLESFPPTGVLVIRDAELINRRRELARIRRVTTDQTMLEGQPSCPICIVDYRLDEVISQLVCGHRFHPECIRQWLRAQRSCPFCRRVL